MATVTEEPKVVGLLEIEFADTTSLSAVFESPLSGVSVSSLGDPLDLLAIDFPSLVMMFGGLTSFSWSFEIVTPSMIPNPAALVLMASALAWIGLRSRTRRPRS